MLSFNATGVCPLSGHYKMTNKLTIKALETLQPPPLHHDVIAIQEPNLSKDDKKRAKQVAVMQSLPAWSYLHDDSAAKAGSSRLALGCDLHLNM